MYDWKDSVVQSRGGLDDYFVRKHDTGVIAQDVEKVFPELVRDGEFKTVNYNGLIGLLIECIKHQQHQINELKEHMIGS